MGTIALIKNNWHFKIVLILKLYVLTLTEILGQSSVIGKTEVNLDTLKCNSYIQLANKKIHGDSIILPRYLLKKIITPTFEKILETQYNIYSIDINKGDVIPNEVICFDMEMLNAINKKYGGGFINYTKQCSDSLDSIGQGFIDSKIISNGSVNEIIKKEFKYIEDIKNEKELLILMTFEINKKGKVEKIKFYKGRMNPDSILKEVTIEDKYSQELKRIFLNTNWETAKFYGKPINSNKSVIINYYYLFD